MGIELSLRSEASRRGTGQHKIVCPFCSPQRKKKTERTLSLRVEADTAFYQCWHCSEHGLVKLKDTTIPRLRAKPQSQGPIMAVAAKKNWSSLSPEAIAWLASRGISEKTATHLGIKSARHWIAAAGRESECVVFPYMNQSVEYAAKIRSIETKGFSSHGAPATLFNLHNVSKGDWLIICEGEMDCATLVEAGYESATSIPLGAPSKPTEAGADQGDDLRFRFIWEAKDQIDAADRIIICTDGDGPGQVAAEEIARRIGKDRCWKVEYPEGCKDANEVWMKYGQSGVDDLIAEAKAWPISGLYDTSHFFDQLDEIYDTGMGRGESTGYPELDKLYSVAPGQLTIVTGHPSSGKSELVDQIMVNLAKRGWTHAVCSFENEPRLHIAKLISKYMGKPFFEGAGERITQDELRLGKEFVQSHFSFLYQIDGSMTSMASILERLKTAVMRYGIRGAVIDPYNYILKPGDVAETDWISVMLSQVRLFAQAHGLHVWFVAHPTKMLRNAEGKVPAPKGYDISGSAAWFAKADFGLTIHRPNPTGSLTSEIHCWKCRFSWLGQQGMTHLTFNPATLNYIDAGSYMAVPQDVYDPFADIGPAPSADIPETQAA